MDILTREQIARIYELTDNLSLHRNAVIVPLGADKDGLEMIMPDGRLLVTGPHGEAFDPWFEGLPARLKELDLARARHHR